MLERRRVAREPTHCADKMLGEPTCSDPFALLTVTFFAANEDILQEEAEAAEFVVKLSPLLPLLPPVHIFFETRICTVLVAAAGRAG